MTQEDRHHPQQQRRAPHFRTPFLPPPQKKMGLCKCPKRKVTNLFCFEHRVNVCESCLVSGHQKCIVQSYLQWLQDSDYSPDCPLCRCPLAARDTVRLVCYGGGGGGGKKWAAP
ncbi:zinc finger protein-like 1 [Cuculus canorus]|uniref:zinc finger protein-like 1 n=1 Tax=Cuculus canorus TaxID=55661 RepID=UPI0023AAD277|nr:zinc finger protein-like 1 [Cuculus canorus]